MTWLLIPASLLISLGGANVWVDYQNQGVGYPMRLWPALAVLTGGLLLVAAL